MHVFSKQLALGSRDIYLLNEPFNMFIIGIEKKALEGKHISLFIVDRRVTVFRSVFEFRILELTFHSLLFQFEFKDNYSPL